MACRTVDPPHRSSFFALFRRRLRQSDTHTLHWNIPRKWSGAVRGMDYTRIRGTLISMASKLQNIITISYTQQHNLPIHCF